MAKSFELHYIQLIALPFFLSNTYKNHSLLLMNTLLFFLFSHLDFHIHMFPQNTFPTFHLYLIDASNTMEQVQLFVFSSFSVYALQDRNKRLLCR